MSEQDGSNVESPNEASESNQESKEQYVAKKAYEEVSRDMHKNKAKAREAEARSAQLEAEIKAIKEAELIKEKQFQTLYEQEKEKAASLEAARKKDNEMFLKTAKKSALKQELGGKIKDVYLNRAALNEIEVNDDGTLSSESLLTVANKFRQEFPEVIPTSENLNITGNASPTQIAMNGPKELGEMSFEEKALLLKQIKTNK